MLAKKFNKKFSQRFHDITEDLRKKTGHVSIANTFKVIAKENDLPGLADNFHEYFHRFDFKGFLFHKAREVLEHLQSFGKVVVFTEGQKHYQLLKIKKSGVFGIVFGNVEIFASDKPGNLKALFSKYPAEINYLIEDKPEILIKVKKIYGDKIQTIHVCQGHYSKSCRNDNFGLKVASFDELLKIHFPIAT